MTVCTTRFPMFTTRSAIHSRCRPTSTGSLADGLTHRVSAHKGEELLGLGSIVDSIRRTGGYATDIAETAINHTLSQEA